jgi:hypothetical protein
VAHGHSLAVLPQQALLLHANVICANCILLKSDLHGHRHQYAQTRYRELTGWAAPAAGGPRSNELTPAQREIDREARLTISEELGHERVQIVGVYVDR